MRRVERTTPLHVLETTALCTAKPGECDCFKPKDEDDVVIVMPRIEAECLAAAGGDRAYVSTELAALINEQLA